MGEFMFLWKWKVAEIVIFCCCVQRNLRWSYRYLSQKYYNVDPFQSGNSLLTAAFVRLARFISWHLFCREDLVSNNHVCKVILDPLTDGYYSSFRRSILVSTTIMVVIIWNVQDRSVVTLLRRIVVL